MNIPDYYLSLPHDTSGSRSKNRFRIELLWGVCMMLDLIEIDKDFTVVFDYACDVEVHYKDGLEFYQIKTHGSNSPSFTYKNITKIASKNAEGSILGKLYVLNIGSDTNIKLVLVSNVAYSSLGNKINDEIKCFDELPDKEKNYLQEALKKELNLSNIDLSNVFYLHTDVNLRNPEQEVQGKIVISLKKKKKCEPRNPRALYRLIYDTVSERACYEFSIDDYESLIRKKGITRDELDRMLDCHSVNEKTGIKQTQEYIDSLPDIIAKKKCKSALAKLLSIIPTSRSLKELEKKIAAFMIEQTKLGDIESAIEMIKKNFHDEFPLEYDDTEKTVFYIIIIYKFVEGVYDDENDV